MKTVANIALLLFLCTLALSGSSNSSQGVSSADHQSVLTKRAKIVVGEPVAWVVTVTLDDGWNGVLALPGDAKSISVLTGREIQNAVDGLDSYELILSSLDRRTISHGAVNEHVALQAAENETFADKIFGFIRRWTSSGEILPVQAIGPNISAYGQPDYVSPHIHSTVTDAT